VTGVPAGTLDVFPTVAALAGLEPPATVQWDGTDLSPLLFRGQSLDERPFFYYRGHELFAVRLGSWKAHFITQQGYDAKTRLEHESPLLYHLGIDPSEVLDRSADHPDVVAQLVAVANRHREGMVPGRPQLE
jgi:arylsulfatase A-like enzyme